MTEFAHRTILEQVPALPHALGQELAEELGGSNHGGVTEEQQLRVLIASALGFAMAPAIEEKIPRAFVASATSRADVQRLVVHQVRYDAVVVDVMGSEDRRDGDFDGLDILELLREWDRLAPVIFVAQGHKLEREHLQEAVLQSEVACVVQQAAGLEPLIRAVYAAAYDHPPPTGASFEMRPDPWCIHRCFSRPRSGTTSARIAGAIASGRASDADSLAAATGLGLNTVNKLVPHLGPMIRARGEHDPELRLNAQVIYRWCGEHAYYIRSWCRRHGQADVLNAVSTRAEAQRPPGRVGS